MRAHFMSEIFGFVLHIHLEDEWMRKGEMKIVPIYTNGYKSHAINVAGK